MNENKRYFDKQGIIVDSTKYEKMFGYYDIITELNELNDEKEQYKAFIKQLANNCGKILLMNGNVYNIKKILGDIDD